MGSGQSQVGLGRQVQLCFPAGIDELTRSKMNAWPYGGALRSVGTLTGGSLDGAPGTAGGLADIATEMSKLDFRPPLLVTLGDATELSTQVLDGPIAEPSVSPGEEALQAQEAEQAAEAQEAAETAQYDYAQSDAADADVADQADSAFEDFIQSEFEQGMSDIEEMLRNPVDWLESV